MNNQLKTKAEAIHEWLQSMPEVQEYKRYALLIKQNPNYFKQESHLKSLQKQIINAIDHGEDPTELKNTYHALKETFESDPVIVNYLYYKEEVNTILQQVRTIINTSIELEDVD